MPTLSFPLPPRAFRLHLSSKAGKETHLRATPRFGGEAREPRAFFFDSLISNTPFGPCREAAQQQQQQQQWAPERHKQQQQQQQEEEQENQPLDTLPLAAAPKVTWLPAWRLQQQAACAHPCAARRPSSHPPISALSPLARHHHQRAASLPTTLVAAASGGGACCAAAAAAVAAKGPRPVSLLRCEGVSWEQLLDQVPPEWRRIAALHHSVSMPAQPDARVGARGFGAAAWGDACEAKPGPSPFPDVDGFVESVCMQGGTRGRVRTWVYSRGSATLLLCIKDNRWCGNVGRAHRSNGVYYVVDLVGGTWHQRCVGFDLGWWCVVCGGD